MLFCLVHRVFNSLSAYYFSLSLSLILRFRLPDNYVYDRDMGSFFHSKSIISHDAGNALSRKCVRTYWARD